MTNRSDWEELTEQTIGLIRSLVKNHPTETKVRMCSKHGSSSSYLHVSPVKPE